MHWLGLAVVLLGAITVGFAVFRAFWPVAPGPDYQRLTAADRGSLELRIRSDPGEPDRAEPVPDLMLLRTAARIMLVQRNLLGLWLGCFLIQFGATLATPHLVNIVLTVLLAVPLGWLALYVERRAAAGAAFLRRHPAAEV